jgi:NitT/TauT family transport system permease protein
MSQTHSRRQRAKRVRATLESLAAPLMSVLFLLLWQVAVPIFHIPDFLLPTPFQILDRAAKDYDSLLANSLVTLLETVLGFLIAAAMGIVTALAIFYSRLFERAVYPILVALQTVPKVALAPLLVLYLGYGLAPKCFLAFLLAYFPIVIATVVGLQSLDRSMVYLVRSMGASEWQTFFKLRLPAALASIFGGFKIGISLAVIGAVIGEYVAAERGLGHLQLQANMQFDTTMSFAAMLIIAVIGVLLFWLLEAAENRLVFKREAALI